MNPLRRSILALFTVVAPVAAQTATIHIDARTAAPTTTPLIGVCLEDVNHEIYGGLESQMIFGESFAEPADDHDPSKMWSPITTGTAKLTTALAPDRRSPAGQSQQLTFIDGTGEVGICNRGLNRQGMVFRNGQPYEGFLIARAEKPIDVIVSLDSPDRPAPLARQTLHLAADEIFHRYNFNLTPKADNAGDALPGQFSIRLTEPGTITLAYTFLQPGSWGRFKDLPVRKDVADALLSQHPGFIRYGGSMVNAAAYRWKRMIGPREQRPPYKGTWYEHASNGWGIIDFLNFCEAAGVVAVPDFNIDESPQDLADFIDYVNGPPDSEWGRRRVADGHPKPFNLRHIELGNEEKVNADYLAKFVQSANAIWNKDKRITAVVGDFAYRGLITNPFQIDDADSGIVSLAAHRQILDLARQYDAEVWFDVHVWTEALPASPSAHALSSYIDAIDKLADGAKHRVVVFELNANKHDIGRALSNTDAIIDILHDGRLPMVASANALQVDHQNDNGWDQGLVFLNPEKVWLQPPGYALQMFDVARNASTVPTQVQNASLKVAAFRDNDNKHIELIVLNADAKPCDAVIQLNGFSPTKPVARVSELAGALDAVNTANDVSHLQPVQSDWPIAGGVRPYTFKPYSITRIHFE